MPPQRVTVAKNLFNRLVEFCFRNAIFFTFNYNIRVYPCIALENDKISKIGWGSPRNLHFQINPGFGILIPLNQFDIVSRPNLFLRVLESISLVRDDVMDGISTVKDLDVALLFSNLNKSVWFIR